MNKLTRTQLSAGVSSGLLIGTIMGLSFSPVVGSFIGLLAPLAIAWMTFRNNDNNDEDSKGSTSKPFYSLKITVFCIAALLGTLTGVWLRAHNTLGIALEAEIRSKVAAWKNNGFTDKAARVMVASDYLKSKDENTNFISKGGLFSVIAMSSRNIDHLDPSRYPNITETLEGYKTGCESAKAIAAIAKDLSNDQKKILIESIWELVKDDD